jgi:hypothetical protein
LAILAKSPWAGQKLRAFLGKGVHEGKPLAFDKRFRDGLPMEAIEIWFAIEQIQLAGAARHEEVNHTFGAW